MLAVLELLSIGTFYTATFVLSGAISLLVRRLAGRRSKAAALVGDFCATFELCAALFELDTVLHRYGLVVMCVVFFILLVLLEVTAVRHDGTNSPCGAVADWLTGRHGVVWAGVRSGVMCVAGVTAWYHCRLIWSLSLSPLHAARHAAGHHCHTELRTSVLLGTAAELAATAAFEMWARLMAKYVKPTLNMYFNSAAVVGITLLGMHLTGMYFNPVLATSLTYGCQGISDLDFFLVYWVGPLAGTVLVLLLWKEVNLSRLKIE